VGQFLLELYVPPGIASDIKRAAKQAGATSWIFVPEDETCFLLMKAASIDEAREAARLAGLRFERISEAVTY
jgi:hypothetical protein